MDGFALSLDDLLAMRLPDIANDEEHILRDHSMSNHGTLTAAGAPSPGKISANVGPMATQIAPLPLPEAGFRSVGRRVEVWSENERRFFGGRVQSFHPELEPESGGLYRLVHDNGVAQNERLSDLLFFDEATAVSAHTTENGDVGFGGNEHYPTTQKPVSTDSELVRSQQQQQRRQQQKRRARKPAKAGENKKRGRKDELPASSSRKQPKKKKKKLTSSRKDKAVDNVGKALIGKRVTVYWDAMQSWFNGTVTQFDPILSREDGGEYMVLYDDGDIQMEIRESLFLLDSAEDDGSCTTAKTADELPVAQKSSDQTTVGNSHANHDVLSHGALQEAKQTVPQLSTLPAINGARFPDKDSAGAFGVYERCENPATPRQRPWRKSLPKALALRFGRSLSERMMLLQELPRDGCTQEFTVRGSSGSEYTVTIGLSPSCSCDDNRKGNTCKHIMWVMCKVLHVPRSSPLFYQFALVKEEANQIFDNSASLIRAPCQNEVIRDAREGCLCPICFADVEVDLHGPVVWCQNSCGANVHDACLSIRAKFLKRNNSPVSCPCCNAHWSAPAQG